MALTLVAQFLTIRDRGPETLSIGFVVVAGVLLIVAAIGWWRAWRRGR